MMQRRHFIFSILSAATAGFASALPPELSQGGKPSVLGVIEYGQSNAEAQAKQQAALLRTAYPAALRMPATVANNVWMGQCTVGGRSLELMADAITGLAPLRGSMCSSAHGSTAGESMVLRYYDDASAGAKAAPEIVLFNVAEGGQTIRNLGSDPHAGFFAFANLTRTVRAVDASLRAEGKRYVVRIVLFAQGESDEKDERLGPAHEEVRGQIERAAKSITGQAEGVWMLSSQASSFGTSAGVQSILAEHEQSLARDGSFFCLGPTYCYPFASDFLHHSSTGHDMRGELQAVAYESLLAAGRWDVLRALRAEHRGERQIVVKLSEAAAKDGGMVVAPAKDLGISLVGADIDAIGIKDDELVISTSNGVATAVRIGLDGHTGGRKAKSIPRTNIRSVKSYGKHRDGSAIHKWLCHQEVVISAG